MLQIDAIADMMALLNRRTKQGLQPLFATSGSSDATPAPEPEKSAAPATNDVGEYMQLIGGLGEHHACCCMR